MQQFKDRVAVITGAASGIGQGMARAFASRGMKLVLADLNPESLDAAAAEFRERDIPVITQTCDVSQLDQVQALADVAMESFGAVHVLCNNAGVGIPTATQKMKLEDWKWIIDVDLWGPIYGVKVFCRC